MSDFRHVVRTPFGRYQARVYANTRQIYGGSYTFAEDAARVADKLVRSTIAWRLNFPTEDEVKMFLEVESRQARGKHLE